MVLITHKLEEVFNVADRVTVMRAGRNVATKNVNETNIEELVELMIGRPLLKITSTRSLDTSKPVLEASGLVVLGDKGLEAVRNVSFKLYRGEILGIAGVSGNGQTELLEALAGLRKIVRGKVWLDGVDITNRHPQEIIDAGVSYIPAEALRYSAPEMTVAENLVLKAYRNHLFGNRFLIRWRDVNLKAEELVKAFRIVTPTISNKVANLSGGNIQRLVLARELGILPNTKVILAAYPTRGLDIASTEQIHQELVRRAEKGVAVLLVSEELEELISLSDRIMVMYRGEIVGVLRKGEYDVEEIGLMMTGVKRAEVSA
ncbi:Ribose import ATP-binding protein RbsA [archaeon HR03]|nr:Ribose import ATP-binding protein RbsA [archaeon HR03]